MQIIIPDCPIFDIITDLKHTKMNYQIYFYPEFKDYLTKSTFSEYEEFEEKRKKGENENYICELIRNDSIDEFVIYVNKNNISLNKCINNSIFEKNSLLNYQNVSLIEYAAFFGSIQIFQYLRLNRAEMDPLIWIYAIHGRNPDLFHLLEESNVELDSEMKNQCLKESIKCHPNEFTEYIQNNFYNNTDKLDILKDAIKYYNFLIFPDEINDLAQSFFYLSKYNYFHLVKFLMDNHNINVNMTQKKEIKDKKDGYQHRITKNYEEQNTPLNISIIKQNNEIAQLLIKNKNIDINKKFTYQYQFLYNGSYLYMDGKGNKTPLFIAIENNNLEIVQLLLKNENIRINEVSEYETYTVNKRRLTQAKTPLHIAVEKQNIEILKCLFNYKSIDINFLEIQQMERTRNTSKTALHIAIEKENEEIVKFLIDKGIDQSIGYTYRRFCLAIIKILI